MRKVLNNQSSAVYADEIKTLPESVDWVVVRCWKKTSDQLDALFHQLLQIRDVFRFDRLVLSIDYDLDKGETLRALANTRPPFPVLPIQVSGPEAVKNWTRMLNGPLAYMHASGVKQGKVFCSSFDTVVDMPSFARAVPRLNDYFVPCVSVRRTPSMLLSEVQQEFFDSMNAARVRSVFQRAAQFLKTRGSFDGWEEILPFLCRNTAMFWSFSQLVSVCGFDSRCNDWGGQEDTANVMRQILHGQEVNAHAMFWYDDPRLNGGDMEVQRQKLRTEVSSTKAVMRTYRRRRMNFTPDFVF